jgi:replicative DNA helicase
MAEGGGRVPPQNLDAEESVLGAILLDNTAIDRVTGMLQPDDFYRENHRKIFRAMQALADRSEPADLVTLGEQLRSRGELADVGGAAYLAELAERVPTAANVAHYARMVRDKAVLRNLIGTATSIAERGYGGQDVKELLDRAEQEIFALSEREVRPAFVRLDGLLNSTFDTIERLFEQKQSVTGVPTGFVDFDRLTAGLQPSDLIIVAGRPSMGKTALCMNIAENAALKSDAGVAIFSLEMSKEQLVMRMLCSEARIDSQRLRGGFLKDSDWPKLAKAAGMLAEAPVFIDDTGAISILEMRAKARRLQAEKGLGMIIVDYLQLMRGRTSNEGREREISEISRGLKALAKELAVPVVALSQLNRSLEQRQDKRPMLSDLRESGAIEQDADVIMFVYRDEYYNPETNDKGIVGKQRNGPTDTVKLRFFKEFTRFENHASGQP